MSLQQVTGIEAYNLFSEANNMFDVCSVIMILKQVMNLDVMFWGQIPCTHNLSDFTQSHPLVVL